MTSPNERAIVPKPASLIEGVSEIAAKVLGVANVAHSSALQNLQPFDGPSLVSAIYDCVRRNYHESGASVNKNRSKQNWRWHSPQPQIGERNRSPEVVVERAVAAACVALCRTDWSNQIPVTSGLVEGAGDRRRAIDLVRRVGERHFQLIELKVGSDTPLYAVVEMLGYACLWLLAREDRPSRPSPLLEADRVDLRVLAPAEFYKGYSLETVESAVHEGVRSLGERQGVTLSFCFKILDDRIRADAMPAPAMLLELMDYPAQVHPG